MKKRIPQRILYGSLAILAAATLLQACGGGSGGGTSASPGVTRGVITAFGSVFVNGVEFRTDNNTLRKHMDDNVVGQHGLDNEVFRVGMIVEVHHGADDNNATEIDFMNNLEGPVSNLDLTAKTFSVLGQPVAFDNTRTTPADNTFIEIQPGATFDNGAVVEVSGFPDNTGLIHASFIEVKPHAGPGQSFEMKGFVIANTISVDNTFKIGQVKGATQTVTVQVVSGTTFDLPGGAAGLTVGTFVEVKTRSTAAPIVADTVEAKGQEVQTPDGGRISIEGFPSNINPSAKTFTLMGVAVDASGTVTYLPVGKTFADLTASTKIEVHGTMSGGKLIASRISFQ